MIALLVTVIVLGLLYWIVTLLPLPEPFPVVVKVIFLIALVFVLLGAFGIGPGVSLQMPSLK